MFFLSLGLFLACAWLLPWWGAMLAAGLLGWFLPATFKSTAWVVFAAVLAVDATAFVHDGQSFGLISKRMSGLFGLPWSSGIFLVMAGMAGITALLGYRAGSALRNATSRA